MAVLWSMVIQAPTKSRSLHLSIQKYLSFFITKTQTKPNQNSVLCDDACIRQPVCETRRTVEGPPFFFHHVGGSFICGGATSPTPTFLKNFPITLHLLGSEVYSGLLSALCALLFPRKHKLQTVCEPGERLRVLALGKGRVFC